MSDRSKPPEGREPEALPLILVKLDDDGECEIRLGYGFKSRDEALDAGQAHLDAIEARGYARAIWDVLAHGTRPDVEHLMLEDFLSSLLNGEHIGADETHGTVSSIQVWKGLPVEVANQILDKAKEEAKRKHAAERAKKEEGKT